VPPRDLFSAVEPLSSWISIASNVSSALPVFVLNVSVSSLDLRVPLPTDPDHCIIALACLDLSSACSMYFGGARSHNGGSCMLPTSVENMTIGSY
jgi:hypothetical protein